LIILALDKEDELILAYNSQYFKVLKDDFGGLRLRLDK
jgi:hypothetical protein